MEEHFPNLLEVWNYDKVNLKKKIDPKTKIVNSFLEKKIVFISFFSLLDFYGLTNNSINLSLKCFEI